MIDLFCVFTTGGVILFSKALSALKFDVIDVFIKNILLKQVTSEEVYRNNGYCIAYSLANDLNLVFCAVYQEAFNLLHLNEFLNIVKDSFVKYVWNEINFDGNMIVSYPPFDKHYAESEARWIERCKLLDKKSKVMRTFAETSKGKEVTKKSGKKPSKNPIKGPDYNESEESDQDSKDKPKVNFLIQNEEIPKENDEITKSRLALAKKFSESGKSVPTKSEEKPQSKSKTERSWNVNENVSSKDIDKFDVYSTLHGKTENTTNLAEKFLSTEDQDDKTLKAFVDSDYSSEEDEKEEVEEKQGKSSSLFGRLKSRIQNFTGNKTLTDEDLENILVKFREDLMAKNVAQEVSVKLCESLKKSLRDTKTQAFTSINKTVKAAMETTLTTILTPKRKIDIISEVSRKKEAKELYSIVFIGVNGVGKSTNLAKVAYMLKSQGFKVMLAACDNFRSGAVEQIKTHGRCLDVPVFERGYKEDSAIIAQKALKEAKSLGMDVVLIDTAGRMQNNKPLMESLARLVTLNKPNLILFIGEAIAGNDGVDQLMTFNKALIDNSEGEVREIDGVLLSKFDTVDDKVGAAISMTYTTGKPIVFVGVGQKYTHLKKLNVKTVVKALLS